MSKTMWITLLGGALLATACAAAATPSPPPGDDGGLPAVTGRVTYLQRMALPESAMVTVQLRDVSRADAPALVLAQQVIPTQGKQVPFAFTLSYDPGQIEPGDRITLFAKIEDGAGKLLFISNKHTPVINDGPTQDVELVLVPAGGTQ